MLFLLGSNHARVLVSQYWLSGSSVGEMRCGQRGLHVSNTASKSSSPGIHALAATLQSCTKHHILNKIHSKKCRYKMCLGHHVTPKSRHNVTAALTRSALSLAALERVTSGEKSLRPLILYCQHPSVVCCLVGITVDTPASYLPKETENTHITA